MQEAWRMRMMPESKLPYLKTPLKYCQVILNSTFPSSLKNKTKKTQHLPSQKLQFLPNAQFPFGLTHLITQVPKANL